MTLPARDERLLLLLAWRLSLDCTVGAAANATATDRSRKVLLLGLSPAFVGLGFVFLALGARGTAGVSLQLGRTLLFVCLGLAIACAAIAAAS